MALGRVILWENGHGTCSFKSSWRYSVRMRSALSKSGYIFLVRLKRVARRKVTITVSLLFVLRAVLGSMTCEVPLSAMATGASSPAGTINLAGVWVSSPLPGWWCGGCTFSLFPEEDVDLSSCNFDWRFAPGALQRRGGKLCLEKRMHGMVYIPVVIALALSGTPSL